MRTIAYQMATSSSSRPPLSIIMKKEKAQGWTRYVFCSVCVQVLLCLLILLTEIDFHSLTNSVDTDKQMHSN